MSADAGADAHREAVGVLYRRFAPQLGRFVRRLAADRGVTEAHLDAEGVVQEAFEALLRFPTIATIDNPEAWLCTVARRLVGRGQLRAQRAAAGQPTDHIEAGTRARWTSLSPKASIEDAWTARALLDAIAELPDRQRAATYLRHVQGWSQQEIAAYLDCAFQTAGVHVHRGTNRIRQRLGSGPAFTRLAAVVLFAAGVAGAVQVIRSAIDGVDGYLNGDGFASFFAGLVDGAGGGGLGLPYWVSAVVVLAPLAYLVWLWLRYRARRRRRG